MSTWPASAPRVAPLDGVFLVSLGSPSTYRVKERTSRATNLPVTAGGAALAVARSVGTKLAAARRSGGKDAWEARHEKALNPLDPRQQTSRLLVSTRIRRLLGALIAVRHC